MIHSIRQAWLIVLAAAMLLSVSAASAQAGLLFNRQPPAAEVPASSAAPLAGPAMLDPNAPLVGTCCTPACVSYRHCGRRCVSCCEPPVETVLSVNSPCSCCPVCIPVCLPACCLTCEPAVNCRHGLFAKGIVTYDYACGVSVTVRFKHSGEILVTYRGV